MTTKQLIEDVKAVCKQVNLHKSILQSLINDMDFNFTTRKGNYPPLFIENKDEDKKENE